MGQQRQADCDELTTTKKQVKMRLDVLSNIHAKRDVKVRQDLAREQEMRANLEGDIKSFDDRQAFLSDEIDSFKKIHDDIQSRYALAQKERQQEKNKLEKAEHEFWLKSREMERKVKDAEREYKAIVSQLQVKEARQVELEKRIHEINMSRARRRAKEQQEMARIKAQQERDRQLARMRGPDGERARHQQQQHHGHPRHPHQPPQFRGNPVLQTIRQNAPQLSPIQSRAQPPMMPQYGAYPPPPQMRPMMNPAMMQNQPRYGAPPPPTTTISTAASSTTKTVA